MVKKTLVAFIVVYSCLSTVFAQEVQSALTGYIFDCEKVNEVLASAKAGSDNNFATLFDEVIAVTSDGNDVTLSDFIAEFSLTVYESGVENQTIFSIFEDMESCSGQSATTTTVDPNFNSFNIVANTGVNIRSCAGTNCSVIRLTGDNEIFEVVGEDGDWYQILVDGDTGFISSSLASRGPDAVIPNIEEAYIDPITQCGVVASIKRGEKDLQFILSGENQGDFIVDIIRPNDSNPLKVEAQLDKTFTDTGEPYILQYYRYNVSWPKGIYIIEIQNNGNTSRLAWEMEVEGDYNIFVQCV